MREGSCKNLRMSFGRTKANMSKGDALCAVGGVLGTIADEIQLQNGTFLEFISDEAGCGRPKNAAPSSFVSRSWLSSMRPINCQTMSGPQTSC